MCITASFSQHLTGQDSALLQCNTESINSTAFQVFYFATDSDVTTSLISATVPILAINLNLKRSFNHLLVASSRTQVPAP